MTIPVADSIVVRARQFIAIERLPLAVFSVIALVGLIALHDTLPALAPLIPSLFVVSGACNIATVLLLARVPFAPEARDLRIILCFANAVTGTFAFTLALIVPVSATSPPVIDAGPTALAWTYAFWRAYLVSTAIWYVFIRKNLAAAAAAPRTVRRLCLGLFLTAAGVSLCFGIFDANVLPSLHPSLSSANAAPFREGIASFVILALATFAFAYALSIPHPSRTDRAIAITMVAVALDVVLTFFGAREYSIAWFAARLLTVIGTAMVLVKVATDLVQDRAQLIETRLTLAINTAEANLRATQFRAVWQSATIDGLSDPDYFQALADLGTANLRPDQALYGYVSHFENGRLIVEAISFSGQPCAIEEHFGHHALAAFDGRIERKLLHAGRTTTGMLAAGRRRPWTHFIGAPLTMGGKTHFLTFALREPLELPFVESDIAFVDVLGSQILNRYYQLDQVARIRYQLEHDALTGLVNLTTFRKNLRLAIAKGQKLGIARLNLDRFRDINATQGHMIGDEILVEVAAMLKGVESHDLVARMSGDDFAILMYDVDSETALEARVARYREVFDRPFHTGDRTGTHFLAITSSIGAALFPRDRSDFDGLSQCAEVALQAAKKRGGDFVCVYSEADSSAANARLVLRRELLEALDDDNLTLEYQPTFMLDTKRIAGAEALIRWEHPTRGRLMPGEFLAVAESSGLMPRISRWVLGRTIRDFSAFAVPEGFRCFMNVPATLLDDATFLSEIEMHLNAAPDLAQHLGIEITETEAMQNVDRTILALRAIRRRGLQVAIDDFGTGYSSLAYLKRLPIDVVKIDRIFVEGLPSSEKDVAVAELFLELGRRLKVVSLAEGIESEEQLAWLRENGCLRGQGYLVAPSLSIEALRERLDQQQPEDGRMLPTDYTSVA